MSSYNQGGLIDGDGATKHALRKRKETSTRTLSADCCPCPSLNQLPASLCYFLASTLPVSSLLSRQLLASCSHSPLFRFQYATLTFRVSHVQIGSVYLYAIKSTSARHRALTVMEHSPSSRFLDPSSALQYLASACSPCPRSHRHSVVAFQAASRLL